MTAASIFALVVVVVLWWVIRSALGRGADPTPATPWPEAQTDTPTIELGDAPLREVTPEHDVPASIAGTPETPASAPTERARLLAHLVDSAGSGRPNSAYLLVPLGETGCFRPRSEWIERVSDRDGRVDERELAPGAWRAWFAPTYCAPVSYDMQLIAGDNDLGRVQFPVVVEAGAVRVELAKGDAPDQLGGILSIRSLDSLAVDRWNFVGDGPWMRRFAPEGTDASFEFEHLPRGEYEVRLYVGHGQQFDQLSGRAFVPGDAVVFRRLDDLERWGVVTRVHDARSSSPLEQISVIAFDSRSVTSSEYFGAFGEQITLVQRGDERRWFGLAKDHGCLEFGPSSLRPVDGVVTLKGELASGFGAVILARDGDVLLHTPSVGHESGLRRDHAPPLADVAILADGVVVARTDADGLALVNLPLAPRELRAESPGRCQIDSENLRNDRVLHAESLVQFWLATP